MSLFQRADQAQVIEAQIREAIVGLHERLGTCAIELLSYEASSATALLRVSGGCPDCEMTAGMFIQGIEAHLRRHVPQLATVRFDSLPEKD
jgi:Fe-S cluster biogenesis protein NfuA